MKEFDFERFFCTILSFLGDPLEVLPKLLDILYKKFPGSVNKKGFKVLDEHVRLIQGDGVNMGSIKQIINLVEKKGYSTENLVFGSGGTSLPFGIFDTNVLNQIVLLSGGLLQKFDRDTMKFAIKCSYVEIEGKDGFAVAKDPITDKGKRNKPGRLKLIKEDSGSYRTVSSIDQSDKYVNAEDQLVTVYENGKLLCDYSFDEIRAKCDIDIERLDLKHLM